MFDCVFHQWLQEKAGDLRRGDFLGNIHTQMQTLGKPRLLNFQVLLQKLHFMCQRHLWPIGVFYRPTQKVAQTHDHAHGSSVSFLPDQSSDGIQSVEQKMWLDLPP